MVLKTKTFTKDEITQSALAELRANGARVRKVHNVGYYRNRSNQVEPGWCDVQGYSGTGVAIQCEVKANGDTLKPDQITRLSDLHNCGGIALIAIQQGLTVKIIPFNKFYDP